MLIKKYQADWILSFQEIKLELDTAFIGLEYTIEHIGSTSVPHLAAKPIIDIDIIYQTEEEFEQVKSRLLKIGYYHNGNQGIAEREVFKRTGLVQNLILDNIKHHLYVCPIDSPALKRHILFRDALRKDSAARLTYQTMKYQIAEEVNQNKKRYAALKELSVNDFIDALIEVR